VIEDRSQRSGVALIFVAETGENSIGVAAGANARLTPADIDAASDLIASADLLVMQLETPLPTVTRAAAVAAQADVPVILDPAPAQPLNERLLQSVSVLTPNESEAELLTGIPVRDAKTASAAARSLCRQGVGVVLVTLGSGGTRVESDSFEEIVEPFEVDAVDTTAAGDVFTGAFAVAFAEGYPMLDAVRFANAAAAISVTKLGAQPSAPTREAIEGLLLER
jgi:ribokinase